MPTPSDAAPLRFGRFELQALERRLLVDGRIAPLGGRAFDLLLALAERAGHLVDKATLMDLVWPGLVVQENNLAAQMSALRKWLGDDVIATVPGRGYRFVARLDAASAPAGPAPRASAPALRTNLPGELPALLGRDETLATLNALIDRHRLLSVVGAGGIGKSLLTQHALTARRERYPHGVCWVELSAVADTAALPGAVASALGAEGGQGDPLASLCSAVSSLTMLLALDNAEHLLDAVAGLARSLLDAAPGLRLVITSQAPLKLATEQVLRVGPLAVPDGALPAAEALRFGAVALFAERAHQADLRFTLDDANAAAAIEVCSALDGLPLAIELAASRAPLLGVPQLAASMRERFSLLTRSRNRAAPERQRTLRAAIEWSHDLLGAAEQRVFRRLGVVAGSASLALIEAIVADGEQGDAGDPLDRWAVLDALDTLIDRSLVALVSAVDGEGAPIEPRYRLLETPRTYALSRLDAAGERSAMQRRHAQALAALFDAAYDEYFSGRVGVDDWLRRRELDLDNARDALHWAQGAGDAELALRVGTTMLRALQPYLHAECIALADTIEALISPQVSELLQLKTWIELSCVLSNPHKARSRRAGDQALALARRLAAAGQLPDRFALYHALARAASAAAQADDLDAARALLDEMQRCEDPSWPPQRLLWGAEAAQWAARMSGDHAGALVRGRRLLEFDRARGSHASVALGNLVDAELVAGHTAAAALLGAQLVQSLRGTRHEYSLAFARINLMAALLAQDDAAATRPVAEAAWGRAPAFGLQHAAAAYLALLAALEGRPRTAVKLAAYSEAIYAARGEAREHNETNATQRAFAIARQALRSTGDFARLRDQGARMGDGEVTAIALAAEDDC